jgi:hypothetical protein
LAGLLTNGGETVRNSPIEENTHARTLQGTETEEEAWLKLESQQRADKVKEAYLVANTAAIEWIDSLSRSELSLVTLRKAYASGYFDALCKNL